MKPNVIVALLVGLVLGFAVGKAVTASSGGGAGGNAPTAQNRPTAKPGEESATVFKVPVLDSPSKGSNEALVTVVEFSDYQCPFCSRAENTWKDLQKEYGEKLRMVMKQNPLPFHDRAKPSALAALAAGEQGKYWQMHDKLFSNQQNLQDADLEKYAQEIGLDLAKWKQDMQSPKLASIIQRDQALAQSLGATGTPAFFINGRKVVGAQPAASFKAVIDEEIGKAESLVKAGTPRNQVYDKLTANGATGPAPAPQQQQQQAPQAAAVKKIEVPADAPVKGPKTAKVTIVEWSDFQCPFCSRVEPTIKQITDTYGNNVRVVWRNQPLPFHQNAKPAAEAAMAAHEQGKFWQMHDKLFSNQQALDRASLDKYAQEIGLDLNKYKAAMDSHKFAGAIEKDSQEGSRVGADGTPTFYINGRELVGAQPFESFKAVIDEEIKKADKLLASGVKPEDLYNKLMADAAAAPAVVQAAPEAAPVQKIEVGSSPVKGDKNAPVTIVEFSDFQCPFCSRAVPTLKQIEDTYGKKVKVVFKNQPLPFHQNARPAAMAALAAQEQGKFWEMHDKLFANQQNLDRASLEKYAQEIGLDMNKFKAAMDSNKFDSQLQADQAEAARVGANGTPTFFINGRSVVGAQPFESFKVVIDEELKKAGK